MSCWTPVSSLSNVRVTGLPAGSAIASVSNEMFCAVTVEGSALPPPGGGGFPPVAPLEPPVADVGPPPEGPEPPVGGGGPPPPPPSPPTTTEPFIVGCTSQ